jgi:hypothetical protein
VKKVLSFLLATSLGCLLVIGSIQSTKVTAQTTPRITSGTPLVILLDNSGSMGKCSVLDNKGKCIPNAENPTRIDIVKEAVRRRIIEEDLASTKIGLVEIGNYRGYPLNYQDRCKSVKTLISPALNNRSKIVSSLKEIQPNYDGVTPIAYAINLTRTNLKKQRLLPARILLITDGQPNCEDDYQYDLNDLLNGLPASGIDMMLDIVGYKAYGKDNQFIECAKKHPQMVKYWGSVSTLEELDAKIKEALPIIEASSYQALPLWGSSLDRTILSIFAILLIWLFIRDKAARDNIIRLQQRLYLDERQVDLYNKLILVLAARSIIIHNQNTVGSNLMSDIYNVAQSGSGNFNTNFLKDHASQEISQDNYTYEKNQTLAEAAKEIQQLLKQLDESNPTATEAEKVAYINDETTPNFKHRVAGALQASGEAAIDEFILENKYLKVVKAAIKGWVKPD